MRVEIKIPSMGESISEVTIGNFIRPTGAVVNEAEEIIEIETAKVNQLLYAPVSGRLTWSVSQGDTVAIDAIIGFIDDADGAQRDEVAKGVVSSRPPAPTPEAVAPVGQRETRTKMSQIRKTIARRLVDSLHEAAMLTTFNEVDMSAIVALRLQHKERFLEKHGIKLGLLSFFVVAVVAALKEFPILNSYLDGEEIVQRHYHDIGVAIATERGLVVPVLHNCDRLSFAEIEQSIASYAELARSNRLSIQDLEGGGFTVTNGGVYGSLFSTPLLNPPQVGILGMHAITQRAVVIEGRIEVRPMMYLALSYDHRIVDGKEAVSFLVHMKKNLEDPSQRVQFEW